MISPRFILRAFTEPAFITHEAFMAAHLAFAQADMQAVEHPYMTKMRDGLKPKADIRGDIAVLPINGVLARNPDPFEMAFFGVEDSSAVLDMVNQAAANQDVRGILLNIDSPGGYLTGGPEVADAVRQAAKVKPVVAWTGGSMDSLAYWIGSQATEVVSSRSASVGSIGVYMAMPDYSKAFEQMGIKVDVIKNQEGQFKGAGVLGTSLTEDQRANFQSGVQASFNEFQRSVKAARPNVEADAMRGQSFRGREAKAQGLVDRVGDMGFAMGVLRGLIRAGG